MGISLDWEFIVGLITKKENKAEIKKLREPGTNRKITAINEAHLFLVQNYDAEIAKYCHKYNTHRADWDT